MTDSAWGFFFVGHLCVFVKELRVFSLPLSSLFFLAIQVYRGMAWGGRVVRGQWVALHMVFLDFGTGGEMARDRLIRVAGWDGRYHGLMQSWD